jgi:hypothetical protein
MKAILYSIVILAAGGAAFFTYNHSKKFEALQKERLESIASNTKISAHAAAKETELKKEKDTLAASELKRTEVTQSISFLKATGATLERDVTALNATLKAQEEELAKLMETLKEVNKILESIGGGITLENLSEKIQQIEDDKKAKAEKLDEINTLMTAAEKSLEKNRADVARLAKRTVERNERIGRNAMEAVISSVDQDWGFLVIGAGSNSGFTPQTHLIVMRDGRMIGRVQPSSIEPTQTIAEIDFKSLAGGVRLQPGDRVMLAKPAFN